MSKRAAVILAAGQGTRMKSPTPKVLHRVGGRAMLDWVIDAAEALGCERIVVVVGANAGAVEAHVTSRLTTTRFSHYRRVYRVNGVFGGSHQ